LSVPLDHDKEDLGYIAIALILLPGNDADEHGHQVPLMIDPGGPGGSGVNSVRKTGHDLQVIASGRAVLGFDPRGVGQSLPKIDCFKPTYGSLTGGNCCTADCRRLQWMSGGLHLDSLNLKNDKALIAHWSRAAAISQMCNLLDVEAGSRSILRHVSTMDIVRDMLSILNALGDARQTSESNRLCYWGFSWGSLLGTTFAATYPDRVERIVVDGILHAENYIAPATFSNIIHTDVIWHSFAVYCHAAQDDCSMYRSGDTPASIQQRVNSVMVRLKMSPVTIVDTASSTSVYVSHRWLKRHSWYAQASPMTDFPPLAQWLARIEMALTSSHYESHDAMPPLYGDEDWMCATQPGPSGLEAALATSCTDKLRVVCSSYTRPRALDDAFCSPT